MFKEATMKTRSRAGVVAAAMMVTGLIGAPASAAPCVTASVSVYTTPGFSCQVGSLTFSNISIIATSVGNASMTLTALSPFIFDNEFGLQLNYLGVAGPSPPTGSADVSFTYDVSSTVPLADALLALVGNTGGTGVIAVNELLLSNGVSLSLNGPGQTTATFAPVTSLHALKDDVAISGIAGFATSSILVNAFSPTVVPLPPAALMFGTALIGLGVLGHRRRKAV
jgi:hypothetical protein